MPRFFVGREELLASIAHQHNAVGVLTQTIAGLGGVGKTSVAAAYARANRHLFDVVWWVRAETETSLIDDLAQRARLPGEDDPAESARRARDWLAGTERRWLVIFDNATNEPALRLWLPRSSGNGKGQVLATTRNRNVDRVGTLLDIDTLPQEVATRFLHARTAERNPAASIDPEAALVAGRLGGLPLALEMAGAWIARTPERTWNTYLELYNTTAGDPFPEKHQHIDYPATVFTTWQVSIDAAKAEAPAASKVMAVLGYWAPDNIPLRWLTDTVGDPYLACTPDQVQDAFEALHDYSLITLNPDHLDAARYAITALHAALPGSWAGYQELAPLALALHPHAVPVLPEHAKTLWWILDDIGLWQLYSGAIHAAIHAAIPTFETVRVLATTHLGEDHPSTLTAWNDLAASYRYAGRTSDAITIEERVAAKRIDILGEDHPDTLSAWNNLALSYQSAGRLRRSPWLNPPWKKPNASYPHNARSSRCYGTSSTRSDGTSRRLFESTQGSLRLCRLGFHHQDTLTTFPKAPFAQVGTVP